MYIYIHTYIFTYCVNVRRPRRAVAATPLLPPGHIYTNVQMYVSYLLVSILHTSFCCVWLFDNVDTLRLVLFICSTIYLLLCMMQASTHRRDCFAPAT